MCSLNNDVNFKQANERWPGLDFPTFARSNFDVDELRDICKPVYAKLDEIVEKTEWRFGIWNKTRWAFIGGGSDASSSSSSAAASRRPVNARSEEMSATVRSHARSRPRREAPATEARRHPDDDAPEFAVGTLRALSFAACSSSGTGAPARRSLARRIASSARRSFARRYASSCGR